MTEQAFQRDPRLRELDCKVLRVGDDAGRRFVVLDDTIFYPEGGGQPPDRGTIGAARVNDVQKRDGEIRHYIEGEVAPGAAPAVLDWERRFDHMQQHTGQHLLSAVAEDRFGWATTAFHLGRELSDVELTAGAVGAVELRALEEAVAAEIRAARKVTPRQVPLAEYAAMKVRSRGLPADHAGDVRLVEIVGVDLNTCGGTHLGSTSEIEALLLVRTEPMRGGVRVHFVAGGRARRRAAENEARLAALRSLLNTKDDDLVAAVERGQVAARDAAKRERALTARLAELEGGALLLRPERVVAAHFPDGDAPFVQLIARMLAASDKVALLTAGSSDGVFFVVAGDEVTVDIKALGAEVATALDGKGGGAGRIFQGKCQSVARRDEARAILERLAAS